MHNPIITRFAPSPTGFLHIGGARTALYNWLFAKANGGEMLLRIEDTDRSRYNPAAVEAITQGLTWLGLGWSGQPISQFSRAERHREIANQLLTQGKAYKCFASTEELAEMRENARKAGLPPRYDGRWRERDPASAPKGASPVIRLKAPQDGVIEINDQVQGLVKIAAKELDDLILLRSDGSPTYMLAVVVDDHDMQISHIIRGVDHLTNAARQMLIYNALSWPVPVMAHIPLIHGADGTKLSKRHGALSVTAYREMGYLPQAMRNYLARLGWSHGDDEYFTDSQLIEWFTLGSIGAAAARFDMKKLDSVNAYHLRSMPDDALLSAYQDYLSAHDGKEGASTPLSSDFAQAAFIRALPGLRPRVKDFAELHKMAHFLQAERPLIFEEKVEKGLGTPQAVLLKDLRTALAGLTEWSISSLEQSLRDFAEQNTLKLGKIAAPLRGVLTGCAISPGIFDVLFALGRDESLARIDDFLKRAAPQ